MIIKILSVVAIISMCYLIWGQCDDSAFIFFTISCFVAFFWVAPKLWTMIGWQLAVHIIVYTSVVVMLGYYIIKSIAGDGFKFRGTCNV